MQLKSKDIYIYIIFLAYCANVSALSILVAMIYDLSSSLIFLVCCVDIVVRDPVDTIVVCVSIVVQMP